MQDDDGSSRGAEGGGVHSMHRAPRRSPRAQCSECLEYEWNLRAATAGRPRGIASLKSVAQSLYSRTLSTSFRHRCNLVHARRATVGASHHLVASHGQPF